LGEKPPVSPFWVSPSPVPLGHPLPYEGEGYLEKPHYMGGLPPGFSYDSFCKKGNYPVFGNGVKAKQLQFSVPNIMVNSFTRFVNISLYYGKHTRWFGEYFTGFYGFRYDSFCEISE
jgi:hypothetical protein